MDEHTTEINRRIVACISTGTCEISDRTDADTFAEGIEEYIQDITADFIAYAGRHGDDDSIDVRRFKMNLYNAYKRLAQSAIRIIDNGGANELEYDKNKVLVKMARVYRDIIDTLQTDGNTDELILKLDNLNTKYNHLMMM